ETQGSAHRPHRRRGGRPDPDRVGVGRCGRHPVTRDRRRGRRHPDLLVHGVAAVHRRRAPVRRVADLQHLAGDGGALRAGRLAQRLPGAGRLDEPHLGRHGRPHHPLRHTPQLQRHRRHGADPDRHRGVPDAGPAQRVLPRPRDADPADRMGADLPDPRLRRRTDHPQAARHVDPQRLLVQQPGALQLQHRAVRQRPERPGRLLRRLRRPGAGRHHRLLAAGRRDQPRDQLDLRREPDRLHRRGRLPVLDPYGHRRPRL
ncbi:MAG: Trypsin-like protease, partial [uncultured Corynebacteriales bacterium]